MRSFLNITRHPYEEPYHVNLLVSAGNRSTQAEIGSENEHDRFAFYFRLRIFQISPTGRSAIEFRFNNNQKPPNQQIVEFCIEAYPSDLDRLGTMFEKFSRLEDLTMEWHVHPGA